MISIIIPTLNEEKVIRKTLKNIKKMKGVPYEIIISDGRSTDDTQKIAQEYTDKIVVYEGKERQTIGGGRNLGAKKSLGEYFLFIDADVIIPEPDSFFEKIVSEFKKDSKFVAATVRIRVAKENETLRDKIFSTLAIDWINYFNNNIFKTGSASGEFQFIRKEAFDKLGGFDEKLVAAEDFNMFSRLAKIGKTRMFYDLKVFHSGRRFHKLGWFRVMCIWATNCIYMKIFKRAASKIWEPVR